MRTLIVGRGRMGTALARLLPDAAIAGRGATGAAYELVLLAVPDAEISAAAARIAPGPIVAHLSGATGLGVLGAREAFSVHPLLAVTGADTDFAGAYAAIDATSERALAAAEHLADELALRTFRVASADRPAYHAAASIAANFLVTVEDFAERLAATAGVPRVALAPLASAALTGWARDGAAALTGPIARGDDATVSAQRAALADRCADTTNLEPQDLALFDALTAATRALAARNQSHEPGPQDPDSIQKETHA